MASAVDPAGFCAGARGRRRRNGNGNGGICGVGEGGAGAVPGGEVHGVGVLGGGGG